MGIRNLSTASISTGAKRSKFWDQSAVVITNSFESIQTITVGSGGAATIDFTSIPSTYTHLQFRISAKDSRSDGISGDALPFTFNNDTGANYSYHIHYGTGSGAGQSAAGTGTSNLYVYTIGTLSSTYSFGGVILDILDYKDTNKYKTVRALGGIDDNSGGNPSIFLTSGNWRNTNAINRVTFTPAVGSFREFSTIALYGIKG